MDWLLPDDWAKIFVPDTPLVEIFLRGSVVYLSLFVLLRVVLKRQAGTVDLSDLLVIVLIADAAQNAMSSNYTSIPDGLLLVATIVFWAYALDWLAFYVPTLGKWIHPPPLLLVKDGVPQLRNLRRELISMDELMSQMREQGVDDLADVRAAYMEEDGRISVLKRKPDDDCRPPQRRGV